MNDLPTLLRIEAQRRLAAAQGIPVMVLRKGDPDTGTIALKINLLNGQARILYQIRTEKGLAWTDPHEGQTIPDRDADAYLAQQADFDPDIWLIEVEDRQGRHWFSEEILSF